MNEIWTTPIRTNSTNGTGYVYNPYVIDTPERWDNVLISASADTIIHLGPGEYKTYGFALHEAIPKQVEVKTGWNIIGSGIEKTIIKLVQNPLMARYTDCGHSIFGTYYNTPLNNVVIDGMSFDMNMENQSGSRSFQAIEFWSAYNTTIRNVKVIHWGSDSIECFPICVLDGKYTPTRSFNVLVEDCVVEKPYRLTSGGFTAIAITSDYGIVRNCCVDGRPESGSFQTMHSGNGICVWGKNAKMHDNTIRYVMFGGPYIDTFVEGTMDCFAYNNIYEFVSVPCYANYDYGAVTNKVVFRNNYIELGKTNDCPWPVLAIGSWGCFDTSSAYSGQYLEVLDNVFKLHPSFNIIESGAVVYCSGIKNVRVSNNVFYLQPNYKPFTTVHCGQVYYSNNFNIKPKI